VEELRAVNEKHKMNKYQSHDLYKLLNTLQLGFYELCWHNFEHNECYRHKSIMLAYSHLKKKHNWTFLVENKFSLLL